MKKWFQKVFIGTHSRGPTGKLLDFANKHSLQPGEIVVVAGSKDTSDALLALKIIYYAEKKLT